MTTAERLIREGHIAGLKEGIQKGKLEGKAEGVTEGEKKGKLDDARNMLSKGYPISDVLEITGLTVEDLNKAGILI